MIKAKYKDELYKIKSIDFIDGIVYLVDEKDFEFYFKVKLEDIEIKEFTGVVLDNIEIYTGDIVRSGVVQYEVKKMAGGYYPFMSPVKQEFKI